MRRALLWFGLLAWLWLACVVPAVGWADVFGMVGIRTTRVESIPKWINLLERTDAEDLRAQCSSQNTQCQRLRQSWHQQLASWQNEGRMQQLTLVHRWVNRQPYLLDWDVYNRSDFWATPGQFLDLSGDCEDYAFAKYYTLRTLGWPDEALRLVVLRDTVRDIPHAVLAVKHNGVDYILDNLVTEPLPDKYLPQYIPYYAVNTTHRWVFISPNP